MNGLVETDEVWVDKAEEARQRQLPKAGVSMAAKFSSACMNLMVWHKAGAASLNLWLWHLPEFDYHHYWYTHTLRSNVLPSIPG